MPKALEEKPELDPASRQYAEALSILDYFRDQSGRISFEAMSKYADEIGASNKIDFIKIIVAADTALTTAIKDSEDFKQSLESKNDG